MAGEEHQIQLDRQHLNLMGSICTPSEPTLPANQSKTNQRSFNVKGNDQSQLEVNFTQQKLIHLEADLLLMFSDHSANLAHNDHFTKLPTQAHKLQQYAQASLNKAKSQDKNDKPKWTSFSIMIPTLNFKRVSLVFVEPWSDQRRSREQLQALLDQYFDTFGGNVPNSLVIGEFSSQLGVPIQTGVSLLFRSLQKLNPQPKHITFCCLSGQSCEEYQNRMGNSGSDIKDSFVSSESLTSDYY